MERKIPYFIITNVLRDSDGIPAYEVTGDGIESLHLNDKLYDIQGVGYRVEALKQINSQDTASLFQNRKLRIIISAEDSLPLFGRLLFLNENDAETAASQLDILGEILAILPYEEDLIFYGEIEICRVTKDLVVKWSFSGRDIFVRADDGPEPAFEMKTDRICLYDWLGSYYEIDYDGNVLLDRPPAVQAGKN